MVFRLLPGNYHGAPEGRKLLESLYSKNNNYFLMDRAYEDDKTLVLAEDRHFYTIVHPKKIVSYFGTMINQFMNSAIISIDISSD